MNKKEFDEIVSNAAIEVEKMCEKNPSLRNFIKAWEYEYSFEKWKKEQ